MSYVAIRNIEAVSPLNEKAAVGITILSLWQEDSITINKTGSVCERRIKVNFRWYLKIRN
ncbi:hypothetical protein FLA_1023 [Filimonas lacunae]|nr:hypothetical protein FLA_1023 [Filimonas lacunae]